MVCLVIQELRDHRYAFKHYHMCGFQTFIYIRARQEWTDNLEMMVSQVSL